MMMMMIKIRKMKDISGIWLEEIMGGDGIEICVPFK